MLESLENSLERSSHRFLGQRRSHDQIYALGERLQGATLRTIWSGETDELEDQYRDLRVQNQGLGLSMKVGIESAR